ncbi:hypothetical protein [Piscinibacter sakaiensis]|uniref:hypothetical protein n=1 Tax=Piscinibacter sakaiensis TaxID=1547922 RepID=UPI003AAE2A11
MTQHPAAPGGPLAGGAQPDQWFELVGAVGIGIAEPLTDALEHIQSLVTGGRVDKARLLKLRDALDEARRVGITAQQLSRFATRRVRVSHERVQLDTMLRDMLRYRAREAIAHGLALPDPDGAPLRPAEVLVDATLLHSLLGSLFDWLFRHAAEALQFAIDIRRWPGQVSLHCRFDVPDWLSDTAATPFDSLTWRLIEQIAATLDLAVRRGIDGRTVTLAMEFPRNAQPDLPVFGNRDDEPLPVADPDSMPLAGSAVLIVATRRALRLQVSHAIAHLGVLSDFASSVDEARDVCRSRLPDALIVEQALDGFRLAQLRSELREESAQLAYITITEEGKPFEMSDDNPQRLARVRRSALETALPSVLMFELSQRSADSLANASRRTPA